MTLKVGQSPPSTMLKAVTFASSSLCFVLLLAFFKSAKAELLEPQIIGIESGISNEMKVKAGGVTLERELPLPLELAHNDQLTTDDSTKTTIKFYIDYTGHAPSTIVLLTNTVVKILCNTNEIELKKGAFFNFINSEYVKEALVYKVTIENVAEFIVEGTEFIVERGDVQDQDVILVATLKGSVRAKSKRQKWPEHQVVLGKKIIILGNEIFESEISENEFEHLYRGNRILPLIDLKGYSSPGEDELPAKTEEDKPSAKTGEDGALEKTGEDELLTKTLPVFDNNNNPVINIMSQN